MHSSHPRSRLVILTLLAVLMALDAQAAPARHAAPSRAAPKGAAGAKAPAATSKPGPSPTAAGSDSTAPEPAVVDPDARSVLASVGTAYRGFTSYHFDGAIHMEMQLQGKPQTMDVPFQLAFSKPLRQRTEIRNPSMSVLSVSDGAQSWVFVPQLHQYTLKQAAADSTGPLATTALAMGTPIQRYVAPLDGLMGARILGPATIEVGGRGRTCTVVRARYETPSEQPMTQSPSTFWVDDATHAVVRDSIQVVMLHAAPDGSDVTMRSTTSYRSVSVNEPVPDSLFHFAPPADAQLVETIGAQAERTSPMVGKPAQDFELADLQGKRHKLSGLKGKVVLLDFWATWCGPCRREMPNVVKLHHELATKGLQVVAVNVGETGGAVTGFLKANHYDLPVWLDPDHEAAGLYGANAIPTLVVIDRAGVVSTHTIGLHGEADLRAMLKKAGIE